MTIRTMLWHVQQWWNDDPSKTVSQTFWRERAREEVRDRLPDDQFSEEYIKKVRARIIGQKDGKVDISSAKLI
jgi:hypothetical protein